MRAVGTCSICGGMVAVPTIWMGILPPTPECQSCGAKPKKPHGPVIEMEQRNEEQKVNDWLKRRHP